VQGGGGAGQLEVAVGGSNGGCVGLWRHGRSGLDLGPI
jgi:hypothetical protein